MADSNHSKKFSKPIPLRSRSALIQNIVGQVSQSGKRKAEPEDSKRKHFSVQEDSEEEELPPAYPDDKTLFDFCFGGRARLPGIKRSTLLITITTNKTAFSIRQETELEQFKRQVHDVVKEVVETKENWIGKINTQTWGTIDVAFSSENGNRIIESTKIKAEVKEVAWEEGTRFKRVHLHVMAALTYQNFNGYFHIPKALLFEQIRSRVNVSWGERMPYINLRFIKNAVDSVAEYINKLHNQEQYETLAKRTLDQINSYKQSL